MNHKTIDLIRSNDHLTLSRVISKVESNSNLDNDLYIQKGSVFNLDN